MVQDHHRRQPVGLRGGTGPESVGAGLLRAGAVRAQALWLPVRFRQGSPHLLLPAREQPHPIYFEVERDPKVWAQVCSERGLCAPKLCGYPSDFGKDHPICFFQRARNRILSSDVLVVNHTLFFTLLGGLEEEIEGGILFRNDFVIFDEAHHMEHVASRHIGLSVSSGQMRYALHRLWNPRTEKGLLATLRKGAAVKLVAELLKEADGFFANVETACEALQQSAKKRSFGGGESAVARRREWTELRIRQPELVQDNVTLP